MSKTKKKRNTKPMPPTSAYPRSPHIIGIDWIELPVHSPTKSAQRYLSIGFSPRGSTGRNRAVAIGGTVIVFKRAKSTGDQSVSPTDVLLQIPVDNVELKRQQLVDLGLKPGTFRQQRRGDRSFQWRDEDGHTLRFVGPARRPSDPTFIQ